MRYPERMDWFPIDRSQHTHTFSVAVERLEYEILAKGLAIRYAVLARFHIVGIINRHLDPSQLFTFTTALTCTNYWKFPPPSPSLLC